MTVIPNFILKRMYKSGSLRRLEGGIGFDIINNLGPGQISKLCEIRMNEHVFGPEHMTLLINDSKVPGLEISEENPATFFMNQVITCLIDSPELPDGSYNLTLELISREAGKVSLSVQDQLKPA